MTCHFIVYNVGLGQSVAVLPHDKREYAMMVDCGHDNDFHPIDDFSQYLPQTDGRSPKPSLRSLVLTNYDHDHFSGLPYLNDAADILSVLFPKNLSMPEVRAMKSNSTAALDTLASMRSTYTADITNYAPPYTRRAFSLTQEELKQANIPIQTNHLSQLIFVEYGSSTICIPGDLEDRSWELMLSKPDVQSWLKKTNVLVASHHGRENGYHKDIFKYCKPDCVILSDKSIVHSTQKDMAALYGSHVNGNGITYANSSGLSSRRKTLTTRNDGHILVTVPLVGSPSFQSYAVK